jgi:NitT/TauT family transport system permease protein
VKTGIQLNNPILDPRFREDDEECAILEYMDNRKHIRHSGRHFGFSYPISFWQRLHSAFAPLILIVVLFAVLSVFSIFPIVSTAVSPLLIGEALLATFTRLAIAYCLALICAVPLALMVNHSPLMERLLLPLFDVAQSVPVLAFFPIIIIFFVRFDFLNAAAIFVLFITMLWSIVFNLVGGIKVIPSDIKDAAHVFGVKGTQFVRKILLPATVPYLVTGSLLAWAGGWNIVIVAEVCIPIFPVERQQAISSASGAFS